MRCSVVFGVTLRLLVINISSSSVAINVAAYQRCVTTCETVAVVHRWPCLQHLACCSVNTGSQDRYRLRIAISAYPTFIPSFDAPVRGGEGSRRNIAMPFGTEKLEWCGYRWWKNFDAMFIRFDRIHERDRHTDRQTDRHTDTAWRHRPRLHSIAQQRPR